MPAAATYRYVYHIYTQLLLAPLQMVDIQLLKVQTAVKVDYRLARCHGPAVAAFVVLLEMSVRSIEVGADLQLAFLSLMLIFGQFTTQLLFQCVGQLGADVPSVGIIRVAVETFGCGCRGLRTAHIAAYIYS